jgi:uncharacterized membrane protein YdjX (TVP38/TMEM64 family)
MWLRRGWPLLLLVLLSALVLLSGAYRALTFENFARHYAELRAAIAAHWFLAIAGYVALYIGAVALSIPIGLFLTVTGGILFGGAVGGAAAAAGATVGAVCLFLVARSAFGALLLKRAGPLAATLARGFRADAFNYLLFLRLLPVFPFWLVNLVPALCAVPLTTFTVATAIGIVPATFAFAYIGAGLGSVVTAQSEAYRACQAAGGGDCRLEFHPNAMLTPGLWAALAALGVLALLPVAVRRWRRNTGGQAGG